jgi:hypothetical protein
MAATKVVKKAKSFAKSAVKSAGKKSGGAVQALLTCSTEDLT